MYEKFLRSNECIEMHSGVARFQHQSKSWYNVEYTKELAAAWKVQRRPNVQKN